MAQTKLILRKVNSPYTGIFADITKNSVLSQEQLDGNQIYLKGEVIHNLGLSGTSLTLNKINGGVLTADLSSLITSGNTFTTGSTLIGTTAYFDTNSSLSAYTLDLSTLSVSDVFVTGGTFSTDTLTLTRNDGVSILTVISGITSSATTLDALLDTDIITPSIGDYLIYSGGTWFNKEETDIYFTASGSGQTVFSVLSPTPMDVTQTTLYVNGVKQRYGASFDYIITGGTDVVWVTNKHVIDTIDELEIIYF
jgi:hypothetical protein